MLKNGNGKTSSKKYKYRLNIFIYAFLISIIITVAYKTPFIIKLHYSFIKFISSLFPSDKLGIGGFLFGNILLLEIVAVTLWFLLRTSISGIARWSCFLLLLIFWSVLLIFIANFI